KLSDDSQTWSLRSSPIESGIYHDVKFADVNDDGWPDIVAARSDNVKDGGLYVLLNDGQGSWLAGVGPMVAGVFTGLAIADVNHDGHVDIVASRRGGLGAHAEGARDFWHQVGGVQVWYGDGNGRWHQEVLSAEADAESVVVADINGDGALDIVSGLYQQGIRLWLGGEKGWKKQDVIRSGTWSDLSVGDLESDGQRELIAASSDGNGLAVWHWNTDLNRLSARSGLMPDYGIYSSLDIGDIRNAGPLDISAVRADGAVEVWSGLESPIEKKREFTGAKSGEKLSVYFDSGSALVNPQSMEKIDEWRAALDADLSKLRFEVVGRADIRPIHSDLFPNNIALSRARGESVAAWLTNHGARQSMIDISSLGASDPLPIGMDELSLGQNRRVFVQAYRIQSVRLPEMIGKSTVNDLFHINENKVFREIDGIPGYKVGAGDLLSMTFWQGGKPDEHQVTVQVDGTVSLPYQAELKVSGFTPREIDRFVTEILKRFERHPRVDVRVLKAQSKTVSIFGEIQSLQRQPTGPGTYHLDGKESLVDFLSRAGGPGKDADLTKVQVIRDGKTILLDLDRAIKQGDWAENAIIDDGDTIFIPSLAQSKRQVYVLGEVGKPGIVEFTGDIRFLDAVSQSGGLGKDAYLPDIRVIRADRDSPLILAINFERFMEQGDLSQNLALQDKDVLIIPSRPIANWNKYLQDISPSISFISAPVDAVIQIDALQRIITGNR
ncbi:MAG: SLBB domain-containing protein, partial [Mariprofundaceae bacterium]